MERYEYNVDKMYTYLRGFLVGGKYTQSVIALQYAREKHKTEYLILYTRYQWLVMPQPWV